MVEFYWQRILKPQTDLYGNKRELKKQEEPEFTRMLSSWDPFSDEPAGWFDPEWMFGIKDGFDVAISNPPWVSLMGKFALKENIKNAEILKKIYKENTYMPNLYEYFIQRSFDFLRRDGHIVFIVPDRLGFNESCVDPLP